MNFLKKLFGKSDEVDNNNPSAEIIINIIPTIVPNDKESISSFLSQEAQMAILSNFNGLKKKKQKELFEEINEASKKCNDPGALNILAALYLKGIGVEPDQEKALDLLYQAAQQGSVEAMDNLGNFCNSNLGGKDLSAAFAWWQQAAEKGFASSQAKVALYYKDQGDYSQAMSWARKAAEQNNGDGEQLLGTIYNRGYGVDVDYNEAFKWYKRAAEHGNARAQSDVAVCYANGEGVEKDEQQMFYWYRKSAEQDDPIGLRGMYLCYANGEGVEKNQSMALNYLMLAAERGEVSCQHDLGNYYHSINDIDNAILWFTKVAEKGFARSQNELGLFYNNGTKVAKDMIKAVHWFEEAAAQGHPGAQNNLGNIYFMRGDYDKAINLWQQSAKAGYVESLSNLASCYLEGKGVNKNVSKAISLLKEAAEKGDTYSANLLQSIEGASDNSKHADDLARLKKMVEKDDEIKIGSMVILAYYENVDEALKQSNKESKAQLFLGNAYLMGLYGAKFDPERGVEWLTIAIKSGNPIAYNNLGTIFLAQKDYEMAVRCYQNAANKNIDAAMYNLGLCYACGLGVYQNYGKAVYWLEKASNNGHHIAPKALAVLKGKSQKR